MFRGNARILVRGGGDIGQNFIHDFSQVLYCNGVAKISVRKDIQQKCTHQRRLKIFKKFLKIRIKI